MLLSSLDFDFLCSWIFCSSFFLFLGVRRLVRGSILRTEVRAHRLIRLVSSEGNMWATLETFVNNNLDGMTLIPAPKYGQILVRSWAFAFY